MTRIGMRKLWFQAHKWIGLILAILIIPICVTGAALVWHDALDEAVNPARYAVSGTARLDPAAYVAAARLRAAANAPVAQVTLGEGRDPVSVAFAQAGRAQARPPRRLMVYLDPPSARVLDVAASNAGLVRVMHQIHGSLMVPGAGRQIVGWIGVAMLISSISGLWLWWPTVGSWARGLRWRRHRNFDTNLHHLFGFWIALPLFVLSLTGAWISFPAFFGAVSGSAPQRGPDRAALARAKPLANPALAVDDVAARARAMAGGTVRAITWPTDRKADWTVSFGERAVTVADDSGAVAEAPRREQAGVARLMRRIHDGTGMGMVWQIIIFLGGLLPAILAVTGIIMWWRARSWRGELKRRQRARPAAA